MYQTHGRQERGLRACIFLLLYDKGRDPSMISVLLHYSYLSKTFGIV